MVAAVGAVAAVVMATGYVVVLVGGVHVDPVRQAAVGAVVAVIEVALPLVANVPAFASVLGVPPPVVNVVAAAVTCQPMAVPVASLIRYDWSAVVVSTSTWSRPLSVAPHPRADGEVRFSEPEVRLSVPVSVQDVPAAVAVPHGAAWAVPARIRTGAPIPTVSSAQAPRRRARRLFVVCIRCLIAVPSPHLGSREQYSLSVVK